MELVISSSAIAASVAIVICAMWFSVRNHARERIKQLHDKLLALVSQDRIPECPVLEHAVTARSLIFENDFDSEALWWRRCPAQSGVRTPGLDAARVVVRETSHSDATKIQASYSSTQRYRRSASAKPFLFPLLRCLTMSVFEKETQIRFS
jgi:hypothetical protein